MVNGLELLGNLPAVIKFHVFARVGTFLVPFVQMVVGVYQSGGQTAGVLAREIPSGILLDDLPHVENVRADHRAAGADGLDDCDRLVL